MSILIKGMSMPEKGHILSVVIKDGKVIGANSGEVLSKEVIELPPHGDLIDRDAVLAILSDKNAAWDGYEKVKALPTIIESEYEDG